MGRTSLATASYARKGQVGAAASLLLASISVTTLMMTTGVVAVSRAAASLGKQGMALCAHSRSTCHFMESKARGPLSFVSSFSSSCSPLIAGPQRWWSSSSSSTSSPLPPSSTSSPHRSFSFPSSSLLRQSAYAKGRPSIDDVERLSRGQAAKKRGTGSRNICHRLNEMERKEFDLAKKAGFVQLRGTGYRRERKGSPLANIHRQLCDAMARPCIEIHRGLGTDAVDEVVVDLSTLRPTSPPVLVQQQQQPPPDATAQEEEGEEGGQVLAGEEPEALLTPLQQALQICQAVEAELLVPAQAAATAAAAAAEGEKEVVADGGDVSGGGVEEEWEKTRLAFDEEDWQTKPIWELPVLPYIYQCGTNDRSLAKRVAQAVQERTAKVGGGKNKRS